MKRPYRKTIPLLLNESWWGGASHFGSIMPWKPGASLDLRGENFYNQASPLLLSSTGRWIWSERPFKFSFHERSLALQGEAIFESGKKSTLRDAFLYVSNRFFSASGKMPDKLLFTAPQYNTWIELMYDQTQGGVLKYARDLIANGYPPGVLMIDEGWARYFGDWTFNPERFPDPKQMLEELHELGFKVMLWIVPFICPDSSVFRQLRSTDALLPGVDGRPVIREWWEGHSAVLDLSNNSGRQFLTMQLDALQRDIGIDGFKFDGGDTPIYKDDALSISGNEQTESFGKFGLSYPLNEFRACWKCGGQPLAQRLADKKHSWDDSGLGSLIPNILAQGLLGYSFGCADMIGGGEFTSFLANQKSLDGELFVRYAQATALLPMMQFSAAPWRLLNRKHQDLCLESALLHKIHGKLILKLARESARSGEPMARSLAYEFPDCGFDQIKDQFLLGDQLLVAPVLKKGAQSRIVHLPPGIWISDKNEKIKGPVVFEVAAPLDRLPRFERKA